MAAVTSAPLVDNTYNPPGMDRARQRSPAGFTAVNGRETSGAMGAPTTGPSDTIVVSSDRKEPHSSDPPTSHTTSPSRHAENHVSPEKDREKVCTQPPPQNPPLTQESAPSYKRKRSSSGSVDSSSSLSTSQMSPPRRASIHLNSADQLNQPSSAIEISHPRVHQPSRSSSGTNYPTQEDVKEERRPSLNDDEWRGRYNRRASSSQNDTQIDHADVKMAEALQEDLHGDDLPDQQRSWNAAGRLDGDNSDAENSQYGQYGNDRSNQAAVHVGKRKRVFSNRTKTGCMTCRKRKKKCDEQHPACKLRIFPFDRRLQHSVTFLSGNNCLKGGFLCAGYSTRNAWHKNGATKPPIPLQAKEGYIETADHGQPAHHHYVNGRNSPGPRRDSLHPEGAKVQPIVVEDNENPPPQYSVDSSSNAPRPPRQYQTWGVNGHSSIPEISRRAEYQGLPRIHDIPQAERGNVSNIPPISELVQKTAKPTSSAPTYSGQWQPNGPPRYSGFPPQHFSHSSPKGTAQLALSLTDQGRDSRGVAPEDVERQRMINGELFRFTDPALTRDRDRCRRKLWQLNNGIAVSDFDERQKECWDLFKKIFTVGQDRNTNSPVSKISNFRPGIEPGANIETPFRCQYGYNISIGEDVFIGENCHIIDVCPVKIGMRCWIGQNVTIVSGMAHTGLTERQGANSPWIGKPIEIGVGTWIGTGAMIYPGVTIPSYCYIEPGAIVKESLTKECDNVGERPSYHF